jgi:hypothetical protein
VVSLVMTVTGQTGRRENRTVGKEEYCGGRDSDSDSCSDRAETQENRSMFNDECRYSWDSDTDSVESLTGNLINGEDRAEL